MAYDYETERPWVFTDEGQRDLLRCRDRVFRLLEQAGSVRLQEGVRGLTGSSWHHLAIMDRLVEVGDLREIEQSNMPAQYRLFVRARP